MAPPPLRLQKRADIYAHTISRSFLTRGISLGNLMLPAPEAGEFVDLRWIYVTSEINTNVIFVITLCNILTNELKKYLKQYYRLYETNARFVCQEIPSVFWKLKVKKLLFFENSVIVYHLARHLIPQNLNIQPEGLLLWS